MNTKNTSELCTGDIVVCHGMRCLIDGEIHNANRGADLVYWTQALVLNRDDVETRAVPIGWTRDWQRNGKPAANGEHRWTIQGNKLAQWYVEPSEAFKRDTAATQSMVADMERDGLL